jgi:4-alpha-glucanotransferase
MPANFIDYGPVISLMSRLLRAAASRFHEVAGADLREGYEQFVDEHDERWLHDYAMFRILKSRHDERSWMGWAPEFVRREPARSLDCRSKTRLRSSAELADIVRIDQFRGFEAYWAVPAGSATARKGSWVPGPGDSLFEALR